MNWFHIYLRLILVGFISQDSLLSHGYVQENSLLFGVFFSFGSIAQSIFAGWSLLVNKFHFLQSEWLFPVVKD